MAARIDRRQVNTMFDQAQEISDDLKKEAYEFFRDVTPKRSGNAQRNTRLNNNRIVADYPYAERLDEGYSRQAPKGMIEPTEKFIEQQLEKHIRKIR